MVREAANKPKTTPATVAVRVRTMEKRRTPSSEDKLKYCLNRGLIKKETSARLESPTQPQYDGERVGPPVPEGMPAEPVFSSKFRDKRSELMPLWRGPYYGARGTPVMAALRPPA